MTKRQILVLIDVDPELFDAKAPSGLTAAGYAELAGAISQVGSIAYCTVEVPGRLHSAPVPAPPRSAPPVTPDQSHTLTRRRLAIETASHVARAGAGNGMFDSYAEAGDAVVSIASKVDTFLEGGK